MGSEIVYKRQALNDAISYGSVWWSWVIADAVFALIFGTAIKRLQLTNGNFSTRKAVLFNVWQLVANVIAWSIVAPLGDILLFSEPATKVFLQGFVATGVNFVSTLILGTIILAAYNKTQVKRGSLAKED